ncbi:MAG: YicC/YloC family endoribonuclease [Hyphomicrobiales bacterium]
MSLTSMTGFARDNGSTGPWSWQWEIKSVNGKALDLRLRLPPGLEHLDAEARLRLQKALRRGNVQINLVLQQAGGSETVTVNEALLTQLAGLAEKLRAASNGPPVQVEALLGLRGVIESQPVATSEKDAAERDAAILASLDKAIAALEMARREEGTRLLEVVRSQIKRIRELTEAARAHPARQPEALRQRLKEQVARILEVSSELDPDRLHQEAVLMATRADIEEELDRLQSHIAAAEVLVGAKEPVGRKFDFLAQEFNREANTLCSKANDRGLTAIGLDLKTVIDQMREQVQNIE